MSDAFQVIFADEEAFSSASFADRGHHGVPSFRDRSFNAASTVEHVEDVHFDLPEDRFRNDGQIPFVHGSAAEEFFGDESLDALVDVFRHDRVVEVLHDETAVHSYNAIKAVNSLGGSPFPSRQACGLPDRQIPW